MLGERGRRAAAWAGMMVVLVGVFGRAVSPTEPFPWWESDAFGFAPPLAGLTPTWALLVDVLILLGAATTVLLTRGGPGVAGVLLLTIGLGVVGFHAATDVETVSAGAHLAAGVGALVAAWAGSSLPGARRVMVGVALGFGVMLAAVGAEDVFIEHPRTVAAFELTKDDFYQARGWDPDGPEAAMYEERLSHADPTGWFGLTNVLATFAGASAVGLLAAALAGLRGPEPGVADGPMPRAGRLALVAGAVASAWVLMMTGSKGAIGAAALAGLVVAVFWARCRPWVGRAVLIASVLVVGAVAARGLVGERLGERSLLFRSQYQRGTAAVLAESPLVGAGPGRFQDAYTRLKPFEAPEDVTSPHSVGFDWAGLLGVGGLAWIALLASGWWRRAPDKEEAAGTPPDTRMLVRSAGLVVGSAVVVSALTTRQTLAPEGALALVAGGAGWLGVAGLLAAWGGSLRAAALGGAAVAMIHGQLDVTPVWSVSAPLWGLLVGCGLGALAAEPGAPRGGRRAGWLRAGLPAAGLVGAACLLGVRWPGIARWERGLDEAAEWPARIAEARAELASARERDDPEAFRELGERLGGWLGVGAVPPDHLDGAIDVTMARSLEPAAEGLSRALAARETHTGTRIALGRVLLNMALRDRERGPDAGRAAWDRAVASAEAGVAVRPEDPDAWSWLGTVCEQRAGAGEAAGRVWLERAVDAWSRADGLNPHAPSSAARMAEVLADLGRAAEAADWAVRAIGRDEALRLDPRRRLNPQRRARLEALVRDAGAVRP